MHRPIIFDMDASLNKRIDRNHTRRVHTVEKFIVKPGNH